MTYVDHEIATQPENWRRAAAMAASVAEKLPARGERVAFSGCGTSWFMSMAAASLNEQRGWGEADAATSSEFLHSRRYDRVVTISRSGTTTEVVDLLRRLKGGPRTTVITAVPASPVTEHADDVLCLDFVDEQSVVQTRFATTVLALIRAHLGEDLEPAARDAEAALTVPIEQLASVGQISFLGTGWTIALANEAALKARESAQFWAEAYPGMDYRHGPISIAQPGRLVWYFGALPEGLEAQVRSTGVAFESSAMDPMAHLVVAQRVAVQLAKNQGLDPDQPRNLTRSIILD